MLDLGRPEPITSHLLERACADTKIRHGFFTRRGGVSDGIYRGLNVGLGSDDQPGHIVENRNRVCHWFNQPSEQLVTTHQIHSTTVFVTEEPFTAERPKADAIVTATPGLVIGILTADCSPILFADPKAGIVGAAHAGWRGALDGVAECTIEQMEKLGATRSRIVACVGPSIGGENYEVGPEFIDRFIEHDPDSATFFAPSGRDGHHLFDLQNYTLNRLILAGITAHRSGHCTYADKESFFSYRRTTHNKEPDYGRQISAISIVDGG